MYRTINDFLSDWQREAESTLKLFEQLTDASLSQRITAQGRTLGRLAWHITVTVSEMTHLAGIPIPALADEYVDGPTSAQLLKDTYQRDADAVAKLVAKHWTDEMLTDDVPMYGGDNWKKGQVLSILIGHQTHHRGQMTVLMRQAGLQVPGMFGPSYEEWLAYGQQPLK
ncbi:MAG: DinB family protein [Bacteroidota bacterium]